MPQQRFVYTEAQKYIKEKSRTGDPIGDLTHPLMEI